MKTKYTKIKKLWKDLKNHQNKAIDTQFSKIALQLIVHLELKQFLLKLELDIYYNIYIKTLLL